MRGEKKRRERKVEARIKEDRRGEGKRREIKEERCGAEGERVGKRGDEGGEVKVKSVEERRSVRERMDTMN